MTLLEAIQAITLGEWALIAVLYGWTLALLVRCYLERRKY